MKKFGIALGLVSLLGVGLIAGNAHFVGAPTLTISGADLTVSGKVAGLGNVPQIHVVVEADASCVNGGGHNPNAANKDTFSESGDFPVQNGKALFALALEAVFSPSCNPPMTVSWSNVSVTVTADDGTFLTYP